MAVTTEVRHGASAGSSTPIAYTGSANAFDIPSSTDLNVTSASGGGADGGGVGVATGGGGLRNMTVFREDGTARESTLRP